MSKYVYDLTKPSDIDKLTKELYSLASVFKTKGFKEFIANKCLKELDDIQSYLLNGYDKENTDIGRYQNNHKVEYGDNYIKIFNNTNLSQDEMWWVSEETREHYPDGISIAYIVEYGTGIKGTSQDDWQTDVNGHGAKGWVYISPNVNHYVWTNGIEGKFIYQKLYDKIVKNFDSWYMEYIERLAK